MFKLMRFLKKYWFYAILAPLFMVLEVMMDMELTKQMQLMIDYGVSSGNIDVIVEKGIRMIIIVLVGVTGGFLSGVFANIASCNFANDLREELFSKIMKLSYDQTDKFQTASLITRVTNDITQMQNFVNQIIRMFIRSFGMFALGIIYMLQINPKFSLVLGIVLPIEIILMITMGKKIFPQFSIIQKKLDGINLVVHENLTGARVVKAFSKENHEIKRFGKANDEYTTIMLSVSKIISLLAPVFMILIYACQMSIYSIGGDSIFTAFSSNTAPVISVGQTSQAITYIVMICFSLITFAMVFGTIAKAAASAKRINEVLDCSLDIMDGNFELSKLSKCGEVEFKNVSFAYPDSSNNVLNDLSFSIHKGETVAIVGATGCGKSTLVNLITRFYDVTSGEVLVDGINVKEYNQKELRDKIAIALQKSELFAGTIKENIKWGKLDATDEEVLKAAEISQAMEFIDSKEKKFDEYVEEKGTSLSGGQKQRLSIARAIIKNPEILIFDDSTSALDLVTEAKLYKAMRKEINDTTRIVVAQRIATAKNADRIIVLENGSIVAFDTHDNLMKNCTIYHDIYNSQLKMEA